MAGGDTARKYHELTSATSTSERRSPVEDPRVLREFETDVLETFPAPCKTYPAELPVVALPREWPAAGGCATAVLAGRSVAEPVGLDLVRIARILHLSAGVVRLAERADGRRYMFRASGSAGGRFPLELYLAARGVDGLSDGVYWFDPIGHALVLTGPPPGGETTTLVVTGVPWRSGWRYAERAYRHLYWDAGAMLAHTLAVAEDARLTPRLRTVFPDSAVSELVGADGVDEFPLAIVSFGDGAPAIRPGGAATTGTVDRRPPLEFPLITEVQHAGDVSHLGGSRSFGPVLLGRLPPSDDLDAVILRRISTRAFDRSRSVPRELLDWLLAAGLRGCELPHFIAAHAVAGLEPGLYRWPFLDEPMRAGNLRDELLHACMDQELSRDGAFVVIAAVDLDRLDDRAYRGAQLEAGIVDGRLHLAAFALGLGATGMTFVDAEIPRLLGKPLAGLLCTCVGVPSYRHRSGGPPGAPIRMRPLKLR